MAKTKPYAKWPKNKDQRWVEMANHFGRDLMAAARDHAFGQIPADASREVKAVAKKAAMDAIYGMLMLLDGVAGTGIDEENSVQYALSARVLSRCEDGRKLEEIELAPEGDGLCMGFSDWIDEPQAGKSGAVKKTRKFNALDWRPRFTMNQDSELFQYFEASLREENWFYVLVTSKDCGLVPGSRVLPAKLPPEAVKADIFVEKDFDSIAYFHNMRRLGVFGTGPDNKWFVDIREIPVEDVLDAAEDMSADLKAKFLKAYQSFAPN